MTIKLQDELVSLASTLNRKKNERDMFSNRPHIFKRQLLVLDRQILKLEKQVTVAEKQLGKSNAKITRTGDPDDGTVQTVPISNDASQWNL